MWIYADMDTDLHRQNMAHIWPSPIATWAKKGHAGLTLEYNI